MRRLVGSAHRHSHCKLTAKCLNRMSYMTLLKTRLAPHSIYNSPQSGFRFIANPYTYDVSSADEAEDDDESSLANKLRAAYELIKKVQRKEITYICDNSVPIDV